MSRPKKASRHNNEPQENRTGNSTRFSSTAKGTFFDSLDGLATPRIVFLICVLSFLAYANSLGGDFVFDDTDQIVANQDLRSWDNLGRAFTTHVWAFRDKPQALRVPIPPPYYRPLFTALFTVEYKAFGLWPQGWHLVSLLLHILCAIGVFYVLLRISQRTSIAALAAALFAVYPIHAESVSWISGVTDPLFAVFFLASFYYYLRYRDDRRWSNLLVSLVMFALSTLSKETALSLIPLIFCAELIESKNSRKEPRTSSALLKASLAAVPYVGIGILYLIPRYLVIGGLTWDNPHTYDGPLTNVLITIPFILWCYVGHLVWPVNLSVTYFTRIETNPLSARVLISSIALLVCAWLVWKYRKSIRRDVWYAMALILIPLLPVLDLRKLSVEYLLFDRYLYLSVMGWVWLMALALQKMNAYATVHRARNWNVKALTSAAALLLIIALTAGTAVENSHWANAHALWSQAARVRPEFWVTHYNAGLALYDTEQYQESTIELDKAASLAPDEPDIFNALGRSWNAAGDTSEAMRHFKHAIEIDPEMFESINNLGSISFNQGDFRSAERYFKTALSLRPQATDFHYNLGLCYSRQGRIDEAIPELEKALQSAPTDVEIIYELGLAYERAGRGEEAVQILKRGLSMTRSPELIDKVSEALKRLSKT